MALLKKNTFILHMVAKLHVNRPVVEANTVILNKIHQTTSVNVTISEVK